MDFKKHMEDRMIGMYESYNSVILEEFKEKKSKQDINICRKRFINYLEYKYRDKNIRHEIRDAQTPEQKTKLVKKYESDYNEWKKRDEQAIGLALTQIANTALSVSGITGTKTFNIVSVLLLGGLIKQIHDDRKARNDADYKAWKKNKGGK